MTVPTLQDAVLEVLRRAHPRPVSAPVVRWHMRREPIEIAWDDRAVTRALEFLCRDGQVRRSREASVTLLYSLAPPACRVCGRDIGAGGTCAECGEAA